MDRPPTDRELGEIEGKRSVLNLAGESYVLIEDDGEPIPSFLRANQIVNIPGEPHRCGHCGEVI